MALIGISQIGAIVCSLAVLSNGILKISVGNNPGEPSSQPPVGDTDALPSHETEPTTESNEQQSLLARPETPSPSGRQQYAQLRGSIAGVYSLYGGAGILLLTKLGGFLFDTDAGSPFYLMAAFNAVLFAAGIVCGLVKKARSVTAQEDA